MLTCFPKIKTTTQKIFTNNEEVTDAIWAYFAGKKKPFFKGILPVNDLTRVGIQQLAGQFANKIRKEDPFLFLNENGSINN